MTIKLDIDTKIPSHVTFEMVLEANDIAHSIHIYDEYGNSGKPYYPYHLRNVQRRVIKRANELGFSQDVIYILSIIAILHDAHEDHAFSIDRLRELFGDIVAEAVLCISYKKGKETRRDYYKRVAKNHWAAFVKIFDGEENAYNSELEGNTTRHEYYKSMIEFIKERSGIANV